MASRITSSELAELQRLVSYMAISVDRMSQFFLITCALQLSTHESWAPAFTVSMVIIYFAGALAGLLLIRQGFVLLSHFHGLLCSVAATGALILMMSQFKLKGVWLMAAFALGYFKPETPAMLVMFNSPITALDDAADYTDKSTRVNYAYYVGDTLAAFAIAWIYYYPDLMSLSMMFITGLYWYILIIYRLVRWVRECQHRSQGRPVSALGILDSTRPVGGLDEDGRVTWDTMHVEAKSLIRETLWMSFYNSFVSYALYSYLYMILLLLFDVAFVILPLCVGLISLVSSLTLRVFGKHVVYNSSPTNNYIRLVVAAWIVSLIVSLTLTQWPDTYWPHAVAQFIVSAQASLCAVCPHAIFSAMTTDQANIGNKYIGSFLIAGYVGQCVGVMATWYLFEEDAIAPFVLIAWLGMLITTKYVRYHERLRQVYASNMSTASASVAAEVQLDDLDNETNHATHVI